MRLWEEEPSIPILPTSSDLLSDLPDPGIELGSPSSQVDSLPTELPGMPLYKVKELLSPKFKINIVIDNHRHGWRSQI